MKKHILLALTFFIGIHNSFTQCQENESTKVLLVGDSWAFFMGVDGTIDNVMKDWGHSGNKFMTNLTLAQNGAKTHHFLQQEKKDEITDKLINTPSIKWVHLSLAGNDMLGNWKSQTFTQQQTDSLLADVMEKLDSVVQFVKGVREDVQIVLSGYAYPNFEEVINGTLIPSAHPFYSNWSNMEKPSNQEINQQLNVFTDLVADFYSTDERIHFVPATGITQYTYGQETALGVSPFGTYPAYSVDLPYGNPMYPSPKNSMRDYGITKDCFHLSKKGFEGLIGYTTQKYYHKAMMSDKYLLAEDPQTNGSVSNNGGISSELYLGEANGVRHKTILTFETLYNIEYVAADASIFLHLASQTGGNPVDGQMLVEINDQAFGVSATIETGDFSEAGKASANPCVFGSNKVDKWVRLDLPQNLLEYITVNNITQFKLSAPNAVGALVQFSGVEDSDFAPVLNITYGEEAVTALAEDVLSQQIKIYPNPSREFIEISVEMAEFEEIVLFTIDGKQILRGKEQLIDVSNLPHGTYIVNVVTSKGVHTEKLIKM